MTPLLSRTACFTALAVAMACGNEAEKRLLEIEKERSALPALTAAEQFSQRIGHHGFEADPAWIVIDFGRTVTPDRIAVFPARPPAGENSPANGFPGKLEFEIDESTDFSTSIEVTEWSEASPGAGERLPFLTFEGNRASGRYLRVNVSGFRTDASGAKFFRLGEMVVIENGTNVALGKSVTTSEALQTARAWEPMNLVDGYFWCQPLQGAGGSPTEGHQTSPRKEQQVDGKVWVEIDLGVKRPIDEVHLVPADPKGVTSAPGYGFPTHFRLMADVGTEDEKVILKEDSPPFPGEALPNPGTAQVMKDTDGLEARRIRVECDALWRRGPSTGSPSDYLFALSEIQCWHQGMNFAEGAVVTVSDGVRNNEWFQEALTDGFSSRHPLLSWNQWLDGIQRSEELRKEAESIRRAIFEGERMEAQALRKKAIAIAGGALVFAMIMILAQRARSKKQQESLRERIARDLHDEIGASLSHLAMQGDLARRQLEREELTSGRLENISASARETLDQMRDIVWLLSPKAGGDWQELSLRLEAISRRLLEGSGHDVRAEGVPPGGKPAIERARDLVAFLKESISNAVRHGGASTVRVNFNWGSSLRLSVEDDGKGFDEKEASASSGIGLKHLRERASALGAKLSIRSRPGEGTSILLDMPFRNR